MFTQEEFRWAGVGTATIALLIEECSSRGARPVSGCWYLQSFLQVYARACGHGEPEAPAPGGVL